MKYVIAGVVSILLLWIIISGFLCLIGVAIKVALGLVGVTVLYLVVLVLGGLGITRLFEWASK